MYCFKNDTVRKSSFWKQYAKQFIPKSINTRFTISPWRKRQLLQSYFNLTIHIKVYIYKTYNTLIYLNRNHLHLQSNERTYRFPYMVFTVVVLIIKCSPWSSVPTVGAIMRGYSVNLMTFTWSVWVTLTLQSTLNAFEPPWYELFPWSGLVLAGKKNRGAGALA